MTEIIYIGKTMTSVSVTCLKQISSYLKVPAGKIQLNSEKIPTCNLINKPTTGFVNIILSLAKQSNTSLLGKGLEDNAEIRQWLEYCVTYAIYQNSAHNINQILLELNAILETRTYLVGNHLSIADVAVFYVMQDLMAQLNYYQKETYLNVSRWFDNIQQDSSIRNKKPTVDFRATFLASVILR